MKQKPKALVIGGSGSLGTVVCHTLVEKGFEVAFTFQRNRDKALHLEQALSGQGNRIRAFHLDLTDLVGIPQAVRNAQAFLGAIDVLIVASGVATGEGEKVPGFLEVTAEGYNTMMAINVRGVFFACQETARIMVASSGGKIILVGSIDGVKSVPAPVDYACCKGALWAMTQALAKELGPHHILVNMVAPGVMEGGIARLLKSDLAEEYVKHCSLRRVGRFSEVAKVIAFLAGPKNTYLTGQAVILDGGL
jgi:NAD(P)-dependent dehydrogenase (short-subunit alcohol dehydrogenase family)